MKSILQKYLLLLRGYDKGTVAVTFILALPVLMIVVSIIVQYALLVNARLTLDRAVAAAARSAMTSLPTDPAIDPVDGTANVNRAARMILESISPPSTDSPTSEATTVADALAQAGVGVPDRYAARYSYAQEAAQIQIQPIDLPANPGVSLNYAQLAVPRVHLTISYDFRLTVPWANAFIGHEGAIAGITGRYQTLTSTLDVQLSPGREAITNSNGEP